MYSASVPALALIVYITHGGGDLLHAREGSECISSSGAVGECVNFYKCPTLIEDMKYRRFPRTCTTEGVVPIVCCDSCEKVHNISDAVFVPTGALVWKNGTKSWDKCVEYSQYARGRCRPHVTVHNEWSPRGNCTRIVQRARKGIVGGKDAWRREFPHMALLGYGGDVQRAEWRCGGTLISDRYILTAAHCGAHTTLGRVQFAALGILHLSDPEYMWNTHRIHSVINHPQYQPPHKYHDIALLRTESQVELSASVFPACVVGLAAAAGHQLTATGWGALGPKRPLAVTLQVGKVMVFEEAECRVQYPAYRNMRRGFDNTTQMCCGHTRRTVDTCEGDSGGPIQIQYKKLCMYAVVGVTSNGRACGRAGTAGLYTRLHHYIPWIEDNVWP